MNRLRSMLKPNEIGVEMNPTKFNALIDIMEAAPPELLDALEAFQKKMTKMCDDTDEHVEGLAKAHSSLLEEARRNTRRKNPFVGVEEADDPFEDLRHNLTGESFLRVLFDVVQVIQRGCYIVRDIGRGVKPGSLFVPGDRVRGIPRNLEQMQIYSIQLEMNMPTVQAFITGVLRSENAKAEIVSLGRLIVDKLDGYYASLLHRHSTEGIEIHEDPVSTDIALSIFENVDAAGEIADGKKPDEVSAYSVRKATIVAETIKQGLVGNFIKDPSELLQFLSKNLKDLWDIASQLQTLVAAVAKKVREILGPSVPRAKTMSDADFQIALGFLRDLDPRNITYREPTDLQTAEERHQLEFKNETLAEIVQLLKNKDATTNDLIQYILKRKHELREYNLEENSFFVCKIGNGNPFTGDSPGGLTVVPGVKPVVNIDDVVGSGFDQVKEFIIQVKESAKWHDLFTATSPSKSADKANALLIGPQGCGKSEVLRAVGGDRRSIGIYAQPSDFLTCWKGEAEKNPKRLFEEAIRLQKESKKQVFILIDEVDTILNDDHARGGFGATNLTTEFQQLMDGIVLYPHIAVWAATNHPERIPMPMIRRFSKVAVVGELDLDARVKLLKHFVGFLPIADEFPDTAWAEFGEQLNGAVGDTIRKIADDIWRNKLTEYIRSNPEKAETVVSMLNIGEKFQIGRYSADRRRAVMAFMRQDMQVKPEDVAQSIDLHLGNVAIQAEIATAVETYTRAKRFLAGIRRGPRMAEQAEQTKQAEQELQS